LNHIDEPFADPSLLAVYILSKRTSQYIKVALSGDGGDELFGGYQKHLAEFKMQKAGLDSYLVKRLGFLWDVLPKSRASFFPNKIRQLQRFAEGAALPSRDRYWRWCSYLDEKLAAQFLNTQMNDDIMLENKHRKDKLMNEIHSGSLDEMLRNDLRLVLPGDMLHKVDLMSMANSLEVRVPILDHNVVEFALSLPVKSKISDGIGKRILKDSFKEILPVELFNRPKHGFDVPLLQWFKGSLRSRIEKEWLSDEFIEGQKIFDLRSIRALRQQLFSRNPGDIEATVWSLIIFQHWWKKFV